MVVLSMMIPNCSFIFNDT